MSKGYRVIEEVVGPIMPARDVQGVIYDEMEEIELANGGRHCCKALEIDGGNAMVQLYEVPTGVNLNSSEVCSLGRTMELDVSEDMLGHMFNDIGKPIDSGPDILPKKRMDIDDLPMDPATRSYPEKFIQTGVSVINGLNTLVRDQKLFIFSAPDLPHASLVVQIARQVKVRGTGEPSVIVPVVMGTTSKEASFFMESFRETNTIDQSVMFIDLANGPVAERTTTPRTVLIVIEYLAFEKNMHVLAILTNITDYADSLREISIARKEVPGRRGYPGYIYTDLAPLHERARRQKGKNESITTIPILTMSEDGKTHLIPDLIGYIIEGQVTLSRELYRKSVAPPIDVLPFSSRLKDKDISEGRTRVDHAGVMSQPSAACTRGKDAKEPTIILDEAAPTDTDKLYAKLADELEKGYASQGYYADYGIEETMEIGWKLLRILPGSELRRTKDKPLDLYYEAK